MKETKVPDLGKPLSLHPHSYSKNTKPLTPAGPTPYLSLPASQA